MDAASTLRTLQCLAYQRLRVLQCKQSGNVDPDRPVSPIGTVATRSSTRLIMVPLFIFIISTSRTPAAKMLHKNLQNEIIHAWKIYNVRVEIQSDNERDTADLYGEALTYVDRFHKRYIFATLWLQFASL